jgi:hypothetical protein
MSNGGFSLARKSFKESQLEGMEGRGRPTPLLLDNHVFYLLRRLYTQTFDDYAPLPSMLLDAFLSKLQQETQLGKLLVVLFLIYIIMSCYFDVLFPVPVIGLIQCSTSWLIQCSASEPTSDCIKREP